MDEGDIEVNETRQESIDEIVDVLGIDLTMGSKQLPDIPNDNGHRGCFCFGLLELICVAGQSP